jgi:hypothetical protein
MPVATCLYPDCGIGLEATAVGEVVVKRNIDSYWKSNFDLPSYEDRVVIPLFEKDYQCLDM